MIPHPETNLFQGSFICTRTPTDQQTVICNELDLIQQSAFGLLIPALHCKARPTLVFKQFGQTRQPPEQRMIHPHMHYIRRPQATAGGARPRKSVVEACSGCLSGLGHLPLASFGHLPGIFPEIFYWLQKATVGSQTATLGASLPAFRGQ